MSSLAAVTFREALQGSEQSGEVAPLVDLFADDCQLYNLASDRPNRGQSGAEEFWTRYLSVFSSVRSEFSHEVVANDSVVLEWESTGTLKTGAPVRYRGVSIYQAANGKISSFRTYYDSSVFTPSGSKA